MQLLESIKNWFAQAVPEPTDKNRCVQIGCHYEEVSEMASALGDEDLLDAASTASACYKRKFSAFVEAIDNVDKIELADSLADQIVTAIGVAHMFGIDIVGALNEVNRSNYSKFVDGNPVFDENGKIKKPDAYSPPDLAPFI